MSFLLSDSLLLKTTGLSISFVKIIPDVNRHADAEDKNAAMRAAKTIP
jgi:hypothetical protein